MAARDEYHYEGQYELNGVTYDRSIHQSDLNYIRDDLEFRPSDIVVATYPKAGTTWMQEIVWRLLYGSVDSRLTPLDDHYAFIEMHWPDSGLDKLRAMDTTTRLVKTHLQANFFQRALDGSAVCPKFIVVLRNPKDVLLSNFHFHKTWPAPHTYPGEWADFFHRHVDNQLIYGDYFRHVEYWWQYRNHPQVCVLTYEAMKAAPRQAVSRVAAFLGLRRSDEYLTATTEETSFTAMKARPLEKYFGHHGTTSAFFRAGKVGSWRDVFSPEQVKYIDDEIESKLKPIGVYFE